jgi:hypothetical protein
MEIRPGIMYTRSLLAPTDGEAIQGWAEHKVLENTGVE